MLAFGEWQTAWRQIGGHADQRLFENLITRYQEPHRKYHTLQHLHECLTNYEELRHQAEFPAEVEIAIWFHDALYEPRRDDNEERSAEWARASVIAAGAPEPSADRVYELVMATRHDALPKGKDAQILVDVDLWILGAPGERFDDYEHRIREEYGWVPDFVYRPERRKVLEQFAARSRLFHTDVFHNNYETRARANIERSLSALRA